MNFLKRFPAFEVLLVTTILGIHLYAAFSDAYNFPNAWFMRDDAYYYFKVAQNITQGLGSTFDGINQTNGYHPFWMLICIPVFALTRFDLVLPLRVLLILIAGFNAATAVLIYRLLKDNLSNAVSMAAASFWSFNYYIHLTVYEPGLETPLAAFAIVLFIYQLSKFEKKWRANPVATRQIAMLGLSATVVMFSRLDLVFLAVIGGIWVIFRGKPIRTLLLLDALIIFVSMTSSVVFRTGIDQYNTTYAPSAIEAVILVLILKVITLYFFGAYQHPRTRPFLKTIQQVSFAITTSSILATGLYLLFVRLGIAKGFPRSAFMIDWGLSLILILVLRLTAYWFGNPQIKVDAQSMTPLAELHADWKKWLTEGITYYGILGGSLALYLLYNKIAFGISSPVSGLIKRWWGTLIHTVYESPASDWSEFFGISFNWVYNAWQPASRLFLWAGKFIHPLFPGSNTTDERYYVCMIVFIILALSIFFANSRRTLRIFSNMALIPLAAGCGIQILSYTATAYGGVKEWYWTGQMILTTLAGSVLLDLILHPLHKLPWQMSVGKIKPIRLSLTFASIALSIYLACDLGTMIVSVMRYNYYPADPTYRAILPIVPYLEENTPPGSIIGMTGGGNAAYYIHDRTIVNMDGLINSYDYFRALQNGKAPQYLHDRGMKIVFANTGLLALPPYFGQFAPYLSSYTVYGGKSLLYLLPEPKY
jgi:hypothetical protein